MRFSEIPEPHVHDWRKAELNAALKFKGEEYVGDRHEIFIRLREAGAIYAVYQGFHRVLDDPQWVHVNTGLAIRRVARFVDEGSLPLEHFRHALGETAAERFKVEVDQIVAEERRRFGTLKESHQHKEDPPPENAG